MVAHACRVANTMRRGAYASPRRRTSPCCPFSESNSSLRGVDPHAAKLELKHEVERMGGKLPAEHGFGTEYKAPEEVKLGLMPDRLHPGAEGSRMLAECFAGAIRSLLDQRRG